MLYNGLGTETFRLLAHLVMVILKGTRIFHEWAGELMTEEEKRLADRVSILGPAGVFEQDVAFSSTVFS